MRTMEIDALDKCSAALEGLSEEAQVRAVRWLFDKYCAVRPPDHGDDDWDHVPEEPVLYEP